MMTRVTKWLCFIVFLLLAIGTVFVYSASAPIAGKDGIRQLSQLLASNDIQYDAVPSIHSTKFLVRQFAWAIVAAFTMMIVAKIDFSVHRKYAWWYLGISVLLLIAVLFPQLGLQRYGARRWLGIGSFQIQPSEFAKIAIVLLFAEILDKNHHSPRALSSFRKTFLPMFGILAVCCGLIVIEPDLGTCVVIGIVAFAMWAAGGVPVRYLVGLIGSGVMFFVAAVIAEPYRLKRVLIFLHPERDALGAGYHLLNSFIAIGTGGLTGRGIANGPAKYFFLTECHTDFIFSIICEEAGFLGALLVLMLFLLFGYLGLQVAKRESSRFGSLVALGITLLITVQALLNMAVAVGAVPTKGMALPLISYGGSSLLANMIAIGILLNIAANVEASCQPSLKRRAHVLAYDAT